MKKYHRLKVTTFYDWMKFFGCILLVLLALELVYAGYKRSELQSEKQNHEKEMEKLTDDYYANKLLFLDYLIELEVKQARWEKDFSRYMESTKVEDLYTMLDTYNDISNLRQDMEWIINKFGDDAKLKEAYQKMDASYEEWENWNFYMIWLMVYGNEFYQTGVKEQGELDDNRLPEIFWEVEFLYDTGFNDSFLNHDEQIVLARNMMEWEETDERRFDFVEAKSTLMMRIKESKHEEVTQEVHFEAEDALKKCDVLISITLGLLVALILVNYFVIDRYVMYPLRIRKSEDGDVWIEIPRLGAKEKR